MPLAACNGVNFTPAVDFPKWRSSGHHRPFRTGSRIPTVAGKRWQGGKKMMAIDGGDDRIKRISTAILVIPDFSKPDPKAFQDTIDLFVERYKNQNISVVAGLEARGFIFGPPIALALGAKFVPLRKPKKLPGEVIRGIYFRIWNGQNRDACRSCSSW